MLTPSELLKTELEEFEALLDDGEPSDPQPVQKPIDDRYSSPYLSANSKSSNVKNPKILVNPAIKLDDGANSARDKAQDFELRGPRLSGTLPPLNDTKSENRKKKQRNKIYVIECFTEFHKPNNEKLSKKMIPNIVFTHANDEKEENKIGTKLGVPSETLRESNKAMQKNSYNELVTLFKDSTSQNPTRVFDENPVPSARPIASRRSSIEFKESPMIKTSIEPLHLTPHNDSKKSPKNLKDPMQALKEAEAIKTAKKTIEDLVAAIQCDTSNNYTQSSKFESQKLDLNNWRELTQYLQPSKVEIVIIDIVNFGVQDRTELALKTGFYQDIGNTVNLMAKAISGLENEGKHILIYLHNRLDQRKLFFSKFFFIVKNNNNYPIGLKNEKEIIMNYLITLGILQFKLKFEDKPVSEDKINFVKNKALNLMKGTDNSISPFLCDWLNYRVREQIFVEKYYINQNIKGKTDHNFTYNFLEYLTSISSRFLIAPSKGSPREKLSPNQSSPRLMAKSALSATSSPFKRDRESTKHFTILASDPINFPDSFIPPSTASKKNKASPSPLVFENNSDIQRHPTLITARNSGFVPVLNMSNVTKPMTSLTYLSPRERNHTMMTSKEMKSAKKFYQVVENTDFFDLGIRKPKLPFQNLNSYFKNIISSESVRGEKSKKIQGGYLGFI